jgi:hypothetical protein
MMDIYELREQRDDSGELTPLAVAVDGLMELIRRLSGGSFDIANDIAKKLCDIEERLNQLEMEEKV